MSQTVITTAFEHLKAQQAATGDAVALDGFIFANVPNLDITSPIDPGEGIPPDGQIVYRADVAMTGVVNENAVVYSVTLGTAVGTFDFNWVGLVNKASGTLAMIVHAPLQSKVANAAGVQGNVLTRSFLMEYDGAKKETQITTPAETWQIDFTARLAGMDGRQRLENIDIYGAAAFFGDGWLVGKNGNQYFVTKGAGYVAGLRAELDANQNITVTTKPVRVWLDVCWTGTLTSVWSTQSKVTVADSLADYEQNGVKHYVFALASIDANGVITDLRPKGSLSEQQANSDYVRKDKNLADLKDKAEARRTLELKSAALHDITESLLDTTPGRVMKVGDFGIGGDTVSIPGGTSIQSYFIGKPTGKYRGGADITNTACPGSPWYEFDWMSHAADLYGFLVEYAADGREAIHVLADGKWRETYYVLTSAGGIFNSTFKFGQVGTIGQEQNAATLFSQTGGYGTMVSGAELNWYGNKIKVGIVRDSSDGITGYAITRNGKNLLFVDTVGTVLTDSSVIAKTGLAVGDSKKLTIWSENTSTLAGGIKLWGTAARPTVIEAGDERGFHYYSQRNTDGSISLVTVGEVVPGNYTNFDARYLTKSEIPAGIPMPWPSASEPPGYSFCVGQGFNTAIYPQLAAAYPSGVLPDLRGLFIRGLDAYRGVDPGRNTLLSLQYSQSPRSAMSGYGSDNWNNYAAGTGFFIRTGTDNEGRYQILAETEAQRETRPINMAFNYIVRLA